MLAPLDFSFQYPGPLSLVKFSDLENLGSIQVRVRTATHDGHASADHLKDGHARIRRLEDLRRANVLELEVRDDDRAGTYHGRKTTRVGSLLVVQRRWEMKRTNVLVKFT